MTYNPRPIPSDLDDLLTYLQNELFSISDSIYNQELISLRKLHQAPARINNGMIVYADGTDWEPVSGGGEGLYMYYNDTWKKIG